MAPEETLISVGIDINLKPRRSWSKVHMRVAVSTREQNSCTRLFNTRDTAIRVDVVLARADMILISSIIEKRCGE